MREYISPHKKRPKSRTEEQARYQKAEESLTRRLEKFEQDQLPRKQTIFERVKDKLTRR